MSTLEDVKAYTLTDVLKLKKTQFIHSKTAVYMCNINAVVMLQYYLHFFVGHGTRIRAGIM